jgi:hypothetical protein
VLVGRLKNPDDTPFGWQKEGSQIENSHPVSMFEESTDQLIGKAFELSLDNINLASNSISVTLP